MSEWEFSARTYVTFGEGDGKCGSGGDGAWPCCGSPGGQLGGLLSREEEKGGRGRVKRLRDIPTWFYLPVLSVHWTPIGMFEDSDGAPYLMDRRSRKERPGVIGGCIALLLIHRFNHFNNTFLKEVGSFINCSQQCWSCVWGSLRVVGPPEVHEGRAWQSRPIAMARSTEGNQG